MSLDYVKTVTDISTDDTSSCFAYIEGHNSSIHDGIRPVQVCNRDLLVIQVLCKFGSHQIKNETIFVQTRQNMPVFSTREHNSVMHNGIKPLHERNRYQLMIQVLCKSVLSQIKKMYSR